MIDLTFPVSLFRNYYDPVPLKTIPLIDFFTVTSKGLQEKVEKIRKESDKKVRNGLKATLPCITPSGCFSFRHLDNQISHSGFICIDIDKLNRGELDEVKEKLKTLEYAAVIGKSVSETGLFFICEIEHPDKHKQHFDFICEDVLKRLGLTCDKACSDASRLRGYTWDEDLYINTDAELVRGLKEEIRAVVKKRTNGGNSQTRFFRILDIISNTGVDITANREDWIKIGTGIANEFGEAGYAYFETISANYPEFSIRECKQQWKSCLKGAISEKASINSVFYIAKRYGVTLN